MTPSGFENKIVPVGADGARHRILDATRHASKGREMPTVSAPVIAFVECLVVKDRPLDEPDVETIEIGWRTGSEVVENYDVVDGLGARQFPTQVRTDEPSTACYRDSHADQSLRCFRRVFSDRRLVRIDPSRQP